MMVKEYKTPQAFKHALDARLASGLGEGRDQCKVGGKPYGKQSFGLDVGVGDPMITVPDVMIVPDRLDFAGIAPPTVHLYPIATHLAEKLHIYTYSAEGWSNSRDKDLPDIALIAQHKALSGTMLRASLKQTFDFRNSHNIPDLLPPPPSSWKGPYANKAQEFDLAWPSLEECYEAARRFMDPVLASSPIGLWDPETWAWSIEADSGG